MDAAAHDSHEVKIDAGSLRPGPGSSWLVDGTVIEFDSTLAYPEYGTVDFVPRETIVDAAPSMLGVPITIEHEARSVNLDNFQQAAHGFVPASWLTDSGHRVTLQINTREALDAIKSGARYLSPAYQHVTEERPGVAPSGRAYTHTQTRRRYDNLTLTATPRAGERSALQLDSRGRNIMPTIKLDKTTRTITASQLDSLRWQAHKHSTGPKTDALKTVSLTYDDGSGDTGTLVLPSSIWDKWLGDLGAKAEASAGPDAEASGAMPMPTDMPTMDSAKPKADATTSTTSTVGTVGTIDPKAAQALGTKIDALARQQAADRRAAAAREQAAPFMGARSLAGLDEPDAMLALLGMRTDSAAVLPRATELAKRMRNGSELEQAEARGELSGMFRATVEQLAARPKTDSHTDGDALADLLGARPTKTDAAPVVDSLTAKRRARDERLAKNHADARSRKPATA